MTWDYEAYVTVKNGLAQPPSWDQWAAMPWKRARRWLAFENAVRERQEQEREEAKVRGTF